MPSLGVSNSRDLVVSTNKETLVLIAAPASLTALKTAITTALSSNPTGDLVVRITPKDSTITDTGALTLLNTDGFSGNRSIQLDFNGLVITGGQGNWDKVVDRLPIWGKFNFLPGAIGALGSTRVKLTIKDVQVQGRYSLPSVPTTLSVALRTSWIMLKTTLELPDTSVPGETTWSFSQAFSDYYKTFDAISYTFYNEATVQAEGNVQAVATWVVPAEPAGMGPALQFTQCNSVKCVNLIIRDRTQIPKEYALDQLGGVINLGSAAFLGVTKVGVTGVSITSCSNVRVENCTFYNLDGNAVELDKQTSNYYVVANTFQDIGCNAVCRDTQGLQSGSGQIGLISNNAFYRVGVGQFVGSAIAFFTSIKLTIQRNIIKKTAYSGISLGFPRHDRGTGASPPYYSNNVRETLIDGNLLESTMENCVDGGAIYLLGPNTGGQISNNTTRFTGAQQAPYSGGSNTTFGFYVACGNPIPSNMPANSAHLYYDNGSFLWSAFNNFYDTPQFASIKLIYRNVGNASIENDADPASPYGEGVPNVAYKSLPNSTLPPLINGIIDRTAWFNLYKP
jgi:Right handed beta helix region